MKEGREIKKNGKQIIKKREKYIFFIYVNVKSIDKKKFHKNKLKF